MSLRNLLLMNILQFRRTSMSMWRIARRRAHRQRRLPARSWQRRVRRRVQRHVWEVCRRRRRHLLQCCCQSGATGHRRRLLLRRLAQRSLHGGVHRRRRRAIHRVVDRIERPHLQEEEDAMLVVDMALCCPPVSILRPLHEFVTHCCDVGLVHSFHETSCLERKPMGWNMKHGSMA